MIASEFQALLDRLRTQNLHSLDPLAGAVAGHFERTYGTGTVLRGRLKSLRRHCSLFIQAWGDGPVCVLRAPARINVLGEHVDYVSYLPTFSLTFGSREHEMTLLYRPSEDGRIRGRSTLGDFEPFSFEFKEEPVEGSAETAAQWERYLFSRPSPIPHWSNYLRGAVCFMRMKHGDRVRRGFDFVLDSSVPPAGGASSSSALTVLAAAALLQANLIPYSAEELALDSAKAEWYVGTRGGTMDHLTICLSRAAHAVDISYLNGNCEQVPLPGIPFCWLTFFSHPADKSREIMLEYNERAAISRIWIPALVEDWAKSNPALHQNWQAHRQSLSAGFPSALSGLEQLLENLPETLILAEAERRYPDAADACRRAFPALVRERNEKPLRLRNRARHHLGEIQRVVEAKASLRAAASHTTPADQCMRKIGILLNSSHRSLRDLYELCTPEVESLIGILASDSRVYGARLMGGGFGGNVLALTTEDHAPSLVSRVRSQFYEPRGRDSDREGSIMVSTPGKGHSTLGVEAVLRDQIRSFNEKWREAGQNRASMRGLLREASAPPPSKVRPIILAAGEGTRARESGLPVPKPLAKVLGVPSILRVFRAAKQACRPVQPIVVIVSPETEIPVREALEGEEVTWVLQPDALGTGDAVLRTWETMREFRGRTLVLWGTQPVLRQETVALSLKLGDLFPEYAMIVPTALMPKPYAPVLRDASGQVCWAGETHLESARPPDLGESNVGLFLLWNETMFRELAELRRSTWNETEGRYRRPGGELGFPNELIRRLAGLPGGVLAAPIADRREEKGIKILADVALCEQYARELADAEIEQG